MKLHSTSALLVPGLVLMASVFGVSSALAGTQSEIVSTSASAAPNCSFQDVRPSAPISGRDNRDPAALRRVAGSATVNDKVANTGCVLVVCLHKQGETQALNCQRSFVADENVYQSNARLHDCNTGNPTFRSRAGWENQPNLRLSARQS